MILRHLLRHVTTLFARPETHIRTRYAHFKNLLRADGKALDLIADLESHLYGHDPADLERSIWMIDMLHQEVHTMVSCLHSMNPDAYPDLFPALERIAGKSSAEHLQSPLPDTPPYIIDLDQAADLPRQAGGKAANLSRVKQLGAPTPPGFVITASAFARVIRDNGLDEEIRHRFRQVRLSAPDEIIRITGEIQELILDAQIPADLAEQIVAATHALAPHGQLLAVRSSALAEDGEISFAGQYASELDVQPDAILSAYKRVLAGKYCPRALSYRVRHGLSDTDTAMAVLVLPMVQARWAGVVYTSDPACPAVGGEAMGVYVVDGVAAELVDGSSTPGKYYLSRQEQPTVLQGCACEGHVVLAEEILRELGQWCMYLETSFGLPLDVEWAYGAQGLAIVQARPLHQDKDPAPVISDDIDPRSILLSGLECASPGAACGPVFCAPTGADFRHIPQGSVVFTPSLRPALSQFFDRLVAIVATSGSRASHCASVARERGIPVLVGNTELSCPANQTVTVDAVSGQICSGCLPGLLEQDKSTKAASAHLRHDLAALAEQTVVLSLTDPDAPNFSPRGCVSFHDLVRFCHEKSVLEMFTLVDRKGRGMGRSRRLQTDLPLVLYVLDLDHGLRTPAGSRGAVAPEHIASAPMRALWQGLADPRIAWDQGQRHVDWEEFDRISGGLFRLDSRLLASYAVISKDYLHMNIRFGYHFSLVDSVCGHQEGANYINFRFKGGGAAFAQRVHRLTFVRTILTHIGFDVTTRGDMLDAHISRLPRSEMDTRLHALGLLLAATRLMDVKLDSEDQAHQEALAFMHRFALESLS